MSGGPWVGRTRELICTRYMIVPLAGGPTVPQASKQRPDTPENIQAVTLEREETAVATLKAMSSARSHTQSPRACNVPREISHRATPTAGRLAGGEAAARGRVDPYERGAIRPLST